jgi:hypothetical protein
VPSAFGIEHGIAKRILPDRMPDSAAAVLPGTAVRTYDESPRKKKLKNATRNTAAKVGTGAAVGLGTAALVRAGLHKAPIKSYLVKLPKGKSIPIHPKRAPIGTVVGGTVGGGASSYAGQRSYKNIKAENRRKK